MVVVVVMIVEYAAKPDWRLPAIVRLANSNPAGGSSSVSVFRSLRALHEA